MVTHQVKKRPVAIIPLKGRIASCITSPRHSQATWSVAIATRILGSRTSEQRKSRLVSTARAIAR